ncbi:hypothetical protein QJS04_geneDACA015179 [Acorus gramineus]|uniref:RNase H type-1 domain-containing protein n=1 Tax=Acorus gramineus TaxID=55184 RepID=A0AAV9BBM8_ACOGR|nr:hypothetical protein QJS04_geneDACA015179 [Acorus gramineus]
MECGGTDSDTLVWPHYPTGLLTTPYAWNFLRQKRDKPKWCKWIWQKYQPPTYSACTWLALLDKAPTLTNLQRKGLVREVTSLMCKSEVETVDHLYLKCPFAAFIWSLVLRKMGLQRPRLAGLQAFVDWLDQTFPIGAPQHIMQVAFVAAIRCLWKERCTRLFQGRETHKLQVLKSLYSSVTNCFRGRSLIENNMDLVQLIAKNWDVLITAREFIPTEISWLPPLEGWFKSNSDGSLTSDRAGYGAIVRNCKGEPLRVVAVQEQRLSSINVLEYKAILAGLRLCQQLSLTHVHFESDSTTTVNWLQGKGCFPWQLLRDKHDMQARLADLSEWKMSHSYREGNQVADFLASWRMSSGMTVL